MRSRPTEDAAFGALDALRIERSREGIGTLIEREIREQLIPLARRRPPGIVLGVDAERWTHELESEVVNAFAEHLLRGRLTEIFDHAIEHFRLLLRLRARQFLDNQMRGGESENIWVRAHEILESQSQRFTAHSAGTTRRWCIRGGAGDPYPGDDVSLRHLAWSLPVPPSAPRFRRDTQIASRVLPNEELADLLEHALDAASAALDARQVRLVVDERLDLRPADTISISRRTGEGPALEELLTDRSDPAAAAELDDLVVDAVALLTVRQLDVLGHRYADGLKRDDTARRLGISNGTVDNEIRRAVRIVLDVCEGDRGWAARVLRLILHQWAMRAMAAKRA
jgi:DNA-directed RNA polymerase specialized sigma24 family protein